MGSVLTNKHVVVAMIVAPILAVLAWFATGYFAGEKPHAAREGGAYPLVEQSGCRWSSGECEARNNDVRLTLKPAASGYLQLTSSHPLEQVQLGVGDAKTAVPVAMKAVGEDGKRWQVMLRTPAPQDRFYLVANLGGARYFADLSSAFLLPPKE